jgi:acyl carrier protein
VTTRDEILRDLAELLRSFQGRDYSGPIGPHTRFFGDLGFVSIDAVVLGETLERRYGRRIPFTTFLSDLARCKAQDVEVGELVAFLHESLSSPRRED